MKKEQNSIDALRSGVEAYRASVDMARTKLAGVRARIFELEGEEGALRRAPVAKDDFLAGLCAWIDERASDGISHIGDAIAGVRAGVGSVRIPLDKGQFEWDYFRTGATLKNHGASLIAAANPRGFQSGFGNLFSEVSLCLLFGEQIKDAMRQALDKIEWPYAEATSIESRERRIQEIAAELSQLRAEASELASILEFDNPTRPSPKGKSPEEIEADRRNEVAQFNAWVDRQLGMDKSQQGLIKHVR